MKKKLIPLFVLFMACLAQAGYYFDFEAPGATTAPGYTHVDHGTLYSASLGYGFSSLPTAAESRDRGLPWTDPLLRDFVYVPHKNSLFRLDLPNGDYLVDLAGGDFAFATWERFGISGNGGVTYTTFGCNDSTNTNPNAGPLPYSYLYDGQIIPDGKQHNFEKYYLQPQEFLQVKAFPVTVTSGYLLLKISGGASNTAINYLTVVPEPTTIALLGIGAMALIRRKNK